MENITMEVEYPGVKFFRRLVQMASTDAGEFDAEFEEIRTGLTISPGSSK
ncbi:UNVERIFIED_CONTAM: hypothetical protein Sangu_1142500 [Sesamum angustifolium]|uniref:Uncharacterized protein n=1 Tax=Sesamum angustifolium TaxID=2727405 RepID=A0AAW2NZT5_9LAMI